LLHAADVLALPFIDGVSERRTSFMAGLSHGCAVVTTLGHNTGPTLRAADFFASCDATDRAAFVEHVKLLLADDAALQRLRAAAKRAYAERYDWPRAIASLERVLQN
jgi:glycosyltransferase involved in cell wall biosynthesis